MIGLIPAILTLLINALFILIGLSLTIIGGIVHWGDRELKMQIVMIVNLLIKNVHQNVIWEYVSVLGNIGLILMIFGMLIMFISICGFAGVCCRNKKILFVYLTFITLIWLTIVIFAVVVAIKKSEMKDAGLRFYRDLLKHKYHYNNGSHIDQNGNRPRGLDITGIIDVIQARLKCCGAINYLDFNENVDFNSRKWGVIPFSCCVMRSESGFSPKYPDQCTRRLSYKTSYLSTGCYPIMWNGLVKNSNLALYILIGVCGFLLVMILAVIIIINNFEWSKSKVDIA